MRAVSVHQPWAWAILSAGKTVENRSWATRHRGPLLIHAAKTRASYDRVAPTFRQRFGVELPDWSALPTRAVVGVVDVVDCVRAEQLPDCRWAEPGAYCWVLENPRAFAAPVDYPGTQMLFEVPDELIPAEFRR